MPIISRDDAVEVENRVKRIFDASSSERAGEIRGLFVEVLDFNLVAGQVSLSPAPGNVNLPAYAERVAELDGVHVLYVALDIRDTDRVRKAEAAAAAGLIADQLGDDLLLVITNTSVSQIHLVYPSFESARPTLSRMIVERDLPRRTAVQQVSNIYWNHRDTGSIRVALGQAFDVEAVTQAFFEEYKRIFDRAIDRVEGFGTSEEEQDDKKLFVQTLFNRLMFIYFLSRKGWLTFGGDKDYLNALWRNYRAADGEDKNFHVDRLKLLFFAGLNNPQSRDLSRNNPVLYAKIGAPPFLNGGLFEKTDLDKRAGVVVPDGIIERVLRDLFDRFNFTVMESTPFDIEVAVDPEMLGKVFEELVTGRHDTGSYYTPRPVVSFMCREALKGYLEGCDTGLAKEDIAKFVDERETSGVSLPSAPKVAEALEDVTVVDPACGSGAYLLGMMQELVDLRTALFNIGVDARSLYDLKLHIIQRNLYGVDIDEFAVNIAMLRMWLSLVIEYEGDTPEPLPNLDFKVVRGDSLLGPDPSPDNYGDLFRHRAHSVAAQLAYLKKRHMEATTDKDVFKEKVERVQDELREALADTPAPAEAVDWRVEFVEVFDRGGFDVVIANPPYLFGEARGASSGLYNYALAQGQFDAYWLFHERSINSLLAPEGIHCFINSDALLARDEPRMVREYLFGNLRTLLVSHVGMVFQNAGVSAVVVVGQRGQSFPNYYTVVEYSDGKFGRREAVQFASIQRDPKFRLVTRGSIHDLFGATTIRDHCVISRGEELGKKHLASATGSLVPRGKIGVVTGAGVSRFKSPLVTHLANFDQVRKPAKNYLPSKILVVKTGREFKATIDYEGCITLQSVYNLHVKSNLPAEVVCAVLNSKIVNDWFRHRVTDQKKLFPQITQGNVLEVPIPPFTTQQMKKLINLVRQARNADNDKFVGIVAELDDLISMAYDVVKST